jgi:LuxR family transcriptional regulator, maltose regulon positive regulatory protein
LGSPKSRPLGAFGGSLISELPDAGLAPAAHTGGVRTRRQEVTSIDSLAQANLGGWCDDRDRAISASDRTSSYNGKRWRLASDDDTQVSLATLGTRSRPTVLETKLVPSSARPGHILRSALTARIVQASAPVTIINAPAGYGKTTLLSQCASAFECPVAWVSLDDGDDDPVVLLTEIAIAVDRLVPIDPLVFKFLQSRVPPLRAEVLPRLLNSLSDAPELALLLDDLHVVGAGPSADMLALLCEHLPPNVRIVLAARGVPQLPLGRLRTRGCLLELGAADLALDPAEARDALDAAHVSLHAGAFELLCERTEGWAAGLYLAALTAGESSNPSRAVREFGGDDRHVFDYFSSELLARQPASHLSFLLQTSVLDRFSAPLCDAVLQQTDSARLLTELEQSNLFLVPLDHRRGWFRYHHLFGEMLRSELARIEPGTEAGLHERASRWHEERGNVPEAIEHALVGDRRRAADLLARNMRQLFNTGYQATIRRWLATFSDADMTDSPAVAIGAAWVTGLLGERVETHRYAALFEATSYSAALPFGESSTQSAVARLKATLGWEGVSQMRQEAEFAYHSEPPGTQARKRAAASLGGNLWLRGRSAQACELLDEATTLGESGANTAVFALGLLGLIHLEVRRPAEAEANVRDGFALIERCELPDCLATTGLLAARACLSIERNDHAGAIADLASAMRQLPVEAAMPWWSIALQTFAGRVARTLGKLDQADALLAQARREITRYPDAGILPNLLSSEERALDTARQAASILWQPLTEAELRVLELAPTHLTLEQIGRDRFISRNTVKSHLKSIYGKLNVSSRGEAVARAQAIGLLRPPLSSA